MKLSDFSFDLPDELIARYPAKERSGSRLLCVDKSRAIITDRLFTDLSSLLRAGDLLVFNNTKVIPARLFGVKDSGGQVEVLVERILDEHRALAHVRSSKPLKANRQLHLEQAVTVTVIAKRGDLYELQFDDVQPVLPLLERYGRIPLPPYMERDAQAEDLARYQTVYARHPGAVAAPTAGLHFDDASLAQLRAQGIEQAFVTLHVGAGTFQPIRVENIAEHKMHAERVEVDAATCEKIAQAKARGNRVIAVGTTVVRSLESAARSGQLVPFCDETDIFIYPGYQFRVVDAMVTNFHLPGSTLLLLVSAFAGKQLIHDAYQHAIEQRYRFYSYGDAMFIHA